MTIRWFDCSQGNFSEYYDEEEVCYRDSSTWKFLSCFGARKQEDRMLYDHEFNNEAWEVILSAMRFANEMKDTIIQPEYVMKALLEPEFGLARKIFWLAGVHDYELPLKITHQYIYQYQVYGRKHGRSLGRLIMQIKKFMKEFGDSVVSVEHLVLAFTKDSLFGKHLLDILNLDEKSLRDAVQRVRRHTTFTDQGPKLKGMCYALEKYGKNLTDMAKTTKSNPFMSRCDELERCIRILLRRIKPNPFLIYESNAGKTAIVERLAQLIADNLVPKDLMDCKLIAVNMGDLISGSNCHDEFETRLMALFMEVEDSDGEIILFLDDIHTMFGSDADMKSIQARSVLKYMLSRNKARCIGATTVDKYSRYFNNDQVLDHWFESIFVKQPSVQETISILKGLRKQIELYHGVRITDDALTAAANLADLYCSDQFLVDKAIDLVSDAAAKLNVNANSDSEDSKVADDDIYDILREQTAVPVLKLLNTDKEELLQVEEALHEYVVGQNAAVEVVAASITRWRTGLSNPQRPIARFVLLGPPGVGKKQLAKAVAVHLFNIEEALIKIDMSVYTEKKHATSWLLGTLTPPDCVVYTECLTEIIRKRPYAVILLEEIEKAHPDALDVFRRVLDEGRVTDSQGHTVDFRNTVILMTSHIGSSQYINEEPTEADNEITKGLVTEAAKSVFPPEFVTRVGGFLSFELLSRDQIVSIAKMQLEELSKKMFDKKMKIHFSDAAVEYVGTVEYDVKHGARSIKSCVQKYVENELVHGILRGYFKNGDSIYVDLEIVDSDNNDQPPLEKKLIFKKTTVT